MNRPLGPTATVVVDPGVREEKLEHRRRLIRAAVATGAVALVLSAVAVASDSTLTPPEPASWRSAQ